MAKAQTGRPYLRTAWRTALLGRCPHCAETSMFDGAISMHERCASCDLRYETSPGAWLGALALGYTVGALAAIVLAFLELWLRPIRDAGLHPVWTIVILSLVVTLIGYRWAKASWFSLLYLYDFMAFGDAPPGPPSSGSTSTPTTSTPTTSTAAATGPSSEAPGR
ncbi:MAG: DUF983 domain-containing protein [Dehalococcoidia bacterium]